jgi:uncharacterized protein YkwD
MKIFKRLLILFPASAMLLFSGWAFPAGSQPGMAAQAPLYLPIVFKSCAQSFPLVPPDDQAREQEMAQAINAVRADHGVPPVTLVQKLTQAARYHSRDMADNDFFSHTGSNGSSPGERITQACYHWSAYGEIIAAGSADVQTMLNLWMNSQSHRDIILDPHYQDFGVGYAANGSSKYGYYWTVDFGTR